MDGEVRSMGYSAFLFSKRILVTPMRWASSSRWHSLLLRQVVQSRSWAASSSSRIIFR